MVGASFFQVCDHASKPLSKLMQALKNQAGRGGPFSGAGEPLRAAHPRGEPGACGLDEPGQAFAFASGPPGPGPSGPGGFAGGAALLITEHDKAARTHLGTFCFCRVRARARAHLVDQKEAGWEQAYPARAPKRLPFFFLGGGVRSVRSSAWAAWALGDEHLPDCGRARSSPREDAFLRLFFQVSRPAFDFILLLAG